MTELPRFQLKAIDQFVFGAGMFIAMVAVAVGVVMLVDSRGRFPYVLIGGVVLGIASLWYLGRRYRAERTARGLLPMPPAGDEVGESGFTADTLEQ